MVEEKPAQAESVKQEMAVPCNPDSQWFSTVDIEWDGGNALSGDYPKAPRREWVDHVKCLEAAIVTASATPAPVVHTAEDGIPRVRGGRHFTRLTQCRPTR